MSERSPDVIDNFLELRGQVSPQAQIIAVGGGKGGVGKTFISSSLSIFLANLGYKTYAVDLDIGGANLHTSLGVNIPATGVHDFVLNPDAPIESVAMETAFPNLKLIHGVSESLETHSLNEEQRSRLMSSIFRMPADFIVLDLSAGTHNSTIDFFLMAQHKIIVMTPEPSSIEIAYRFMKAAFYRRIKRFEFQLHLDDLIKEVMGQRSEYGIRCPADLMRTIEKLDPVRGQRLKNLMSQCEFEIILNQARSLKDIELSSSVQSVCSKYFGIPCSLLGKVEHDNAVWQSLRKRRHLLIEYPHSRLYAQLIGIARRLASASTKVGSEIKKAG